MTADPVFPPDRPETATPPPRGRGHTEVEIKLLASDGNPPDPAVVEREARRLGIELDVPRTAVQVDTYLDDPALRLARAGAGLRVRRIGDHARLTLKIRRPTGPDAAHRRSEFEFDWSGPLPSSAAELPAEIRKRVEPVVFDGTLRPFVELRNQRSTWQARAPHGRAEVCIDRVEVGERGAPAAHPFHELEIEQVGEGDLRPWLDLADALRDTLALEPSRLDKLERALHLGRVHLEPLKPPALHPGLSLREAALRVFEGHLRRIQKHEVKARTRSGARPVHKLRVACRRMRAAMQTFAPAFVPGELDRLVRVVKRTARSFDEARDLDVLLENLDHLRGELPEALRPAHDAVVRELSDRRRRSARAARRDLADPKRIQRMGALQRCIEGPLRPPRFDATPPLADSARRLLTEALQQVVDRADSLSSRSTADEVHALRLAMKRLRYTGECFASAFGEGLHALLAHCTELQTVLGEFNDAEVAIARLHALGITATGPDPKDHRERLLVIGAWLLIQERRRMRARARIDSAWQRFDPTAMLPALAESLRTR